jgi:hypothetical protein
MCKVASLYNEIIIQDFPAFVKKKTPAQPAHACRKTLFFGKEGLGLLGKRTASKAAHRSPACRVSLRRYTPAFVTDFHSFAAAAAKLCEALQGYAARCSSRLNTAGRADVYSSYRARIPL